MTHHQTLATPRSRFPRAFQAQTEATSQQDAIRAEMIAITPKEFRPRKFERPIDDVEAKPKPKAPPKPITLTDTPAGRRRQGMANDCTEWVTAATIGKRFPRQTTATINNDIRLMVGAGLLATFGEVGVGRQYIRADLKDTVPAGPEVISMDDEVKARRIVVLSKAVDWVPMSEVYGRFCDVENNKRRRDIRTMRENGLIETKTVGRKIHIKRTAEGEKLVAGKGGKK